MKYSSIVVISVMTTLLMLTSCNESQNKKNVKTETNQSNQNEKAEAEIVKINTEKSVINWTGSLIGIYDHHGIVKLKNGQIKLKGDQIQSGNFVADLTTMKATDDNFKPDEGKTRKKLVGHLSSPDFFNVEKYPEAKYKIQSHQKNKIVGTLSIKNQTHEEIVKNVKIENVDDMKKFTGTLTFDRHKYNVNWKHPMKDKVISDDIKLEIELY